MASREEREGKEVIIAGPEDRRQTVLPEGDDRHLVALASGLLGSPEQPEGKDGSPRPRATWSDWVFLHMRHAYIFSGRPSPLGSHIPSFQAGSGHSGTVSLPQSLIQTIKALPSKGKLTASAKLGQGLQCPASVLGGFTVSKLYP